ncbi:MAG: YicC family protein [Opitutaceae bacterium]|nr:YicC family protein [Opitutaceae bacterium]
MRSMTGYGRATAALGSLTLTLQVTSVNRKTLDLTTKIPEAWDAVETSVLEAVRKAASRGKVHVSLEVSGASSEVQWDEAAANAALDRLSAWALARGLEFRPTPEVLWSVVNAQRKSVELPDLEQAQPAILGALEGALGAFSTMRDREGAALLADLLGRLQSLRAHMEVVALRAPQVVAAFREQLLQRLRQAGLEIDLDDERVLKEIALFADRCDLSEEITRFRSHLEQFEALLRSSGEMGRKAEFILQELGREVHTIGSKANDLTISRAVIELKNELEKIREQVANVE